MYADSIICESIYRKNSLFQAGTCQKHKVSEYSELRIAPGCGRVFLGCSVAKSGSEDYVILTRDLIDPPPSTFDNSLLHKLDLIINSFPYYGQCRLAYAVSARQFSPVENNEGSRDESQIEDSKRVSLSKWQQCIMGRISLFCNELRGALSSGSDVWLKSGWCSRNQEGNRSNREERREDWDATRTSDCDLCGSDSENPQVIDWHKYNVRVVCELFGSGIHRTVCESKLRGIRVNECLCTHDTASFSNCLDYFSLYCDDSDSDKIAKLVRGTMMIPLLYLQEAVESDMRKTRQIEWRVLREAAVTLQGRHDSLLIVLTLWTYKGAIVSPNVALPGAYSLAEETHKFKFL